MVDANDNTPLLPPSGTVTIASLGVMSSDDFQSHLATWFSQFSDSIHIANLRLSINWRTPQVTVTLLRSLTYCLVTLDMSFLGMQGHQNLPPTPILFPHLCSVKYCIHVFSSIRLVHTGLLAHLQAPNLKDIDIYIVIDSTTKPARVFDFTGVDTHLSRPGEFLKLRKFDIELAVLGRVRRQQQAEAVFAILRPQFPNIIAKGFWNTTANI
ncbi:hypothetical protein C8J57DRAFT_1287273 [Mycena rebaudengoi]|nr:hypothetical protein C8J57DRAFT_1287273 [Mycena rebaudengoi]